MKVFVIDQARCNGCHGCQIACKDEHCGNDWMPYQKPQPETGHFWCKVDQTTHGQVPKVKVEYMPKMCQQCDKCPLVEQYPEVVTRRADGLVQIDPVKSEGMTELVDACPCGAVYWNVELNIAQKCDGCAHLVDGGEIPHCVDMCVTEALKFGEEEEFAELLKGDNVMQINPELGPRVYYLNNPGLFIGGEVWDPQANEIIEGAKVVLTKDGEQVAETATDSWGDFWFRNLEAGNYAVTIEAEGFAGASKDAIELTKSLNIGDFALAKA